MGPYCQSTVQAYRRVLMTHGSHLLFFGVNFLASSRKRYSEMSLQLNLSMTACPCLTMQSS